MTENPERAGKLFEIAEHHGLSTLPGVVEPILDSQILEFRKTYLEWANNRERELLKYLTNTPNIFRTYIKHSDRAYSLASKVVWYHDEVIVRDPVFVLLNEFEEGKSNIEDLKGNVRTLLQFLNSFRSLIEQGFILLKCIERKFEIHPPEFTKKIIEDEKLFNLLCETAFLGHMQKPDSLGNPCDIFQCILDSSRGTFFSLDVPKGTPKGTQIIGPSINMAEILPKVDYRDLIKKADEKKFLDYLRTSFCREVAHTIRSTDMANQLNSAVMFDRDVDPLILSSSGKTIDSGRQMATTGIFNLIVPFMKNIPPDRLADLREKMPAAFIEFRHRLFQIVENAKKEGVVSDEALHEKVIGELTSHLSQLETEMATTLKASNIQGYGSLITASTGILVGSVLSAPITPLLALGGAGAFASLKAVTDSVDAEGKARSNPFYFLWKTQQEK
jgi:hypothetical protein